MREGNFAGVHRLGPAAAEGDGGGGVMRGPEGTFGDDARLPQRPRDRVNLRDFQRLLEGKLRQHGGNGAGEHGLTAARRPDEQNIVSARHRHFQRPPRDGLSLDESEVRGVLLPRSRRRKFGRRYGREGREAREMVEHLLQGSGRIHRNAADIARLPLVALGHDKLRISVVAGGNERGQHARHGPQFAVQGELAQKHRPARIRLQSARGTENADGDGQIEGGPLFLNVRGREVDRDPVRGKFQRAVADGAAHPFLGFLHRRVGKPHNFVRGQPAGNIRLHRDGHPFQPRQRIALYLSRHFPLLPRPQARPFSKKQIPQEGLPRKMYRPVYGRK